MNPQALTGNDPQAETAPTLPLMHATFVLAGFGTMLLGPILPLLSSQWHLRDAQSGLLLLAQFSGATLGGASTSHRLERDLMAGLLAAAAGFLLFAFAPSLPNSLAFACAALLAGGFGVGRTIATVNILAGNRYTQHRASALSWLNFSWSFGALLSPLSAAWVTARAGLTPTLAVFAALFLVAASTFLVQRRQQPALPVGPSPQGSSTPGLSAQLFLYFAALLVLYGGLETCLNAWLTTYALRYGRSSLVLSEYTTVLLLCGLTAGRALAAWMLVHMRDRTLQRLGLILAAALTGGLALAHSAGVIAGLAVLLGICLAPIFPATFAIVLAQRPPAREAGIILAASGVGAAALSWLMGVVSTRSGSLQVALTLPVAAALLMLLMSLWTPRERVRNP